MLFICKEGTDPIFGGKQQRWELGAVIVVPCPVASDNGSGRWIVLLACALLLGGCGNSAAAKPVIGRLWTLERFSALGEESPEPPEEPFCDQASHL